MELELGVEVGIGNQLDFVEPGVHVPLRRRQPDDRRLPRSLLFRLIKETNMVGSVADSTKLRKLVIKIKKKSVSYKKGF